ncbi:MAG: hypothetical protein NTY22_05560 [Proteobacteria bacterium]|nr:hypothetical protein [Pseudomonadota bacterium]
MWKKSLMSLIGILVMTLILSSCELIRHRNSNVDVSGSGNDNNSSDSNKSSYNNNSVKDITVFTILDINGTIGEDTIELTIPEEEELASLTPIITITGASINPASGIAQNFTNPVTYTVTAIDGTIKNYTVTITAHVYNLRDIGPAGGWVFYDKGSYSNGWRYLEQQPSNIGATVPAWSDVTNILIGTDTAVGSGQANTNLIIAQSANSAAQSCANLSVTNGSTIYDDWFLPSRDELGLIYTNLATYGAGGTYGGCFYWSSSEYDANQAWLQYLGGTHAGDIGEYGKQGLGCAYLRCIRTF